MRAESKIAWKFLALSGSAVAALALAVSAGIVRGQSMAGAEALDFKVQLENYPPPYEAQAKTMLEGAKADPQPGGILFQLTEIKLESYTTNGTLAFQAEAPQCVFDRVQRSVSSPGPLRLRSANGTFLLEGHGFSLQQTNSQQTNSMLLLSNRVHTVIYYGPGGNSLKP